MSTRKPSLAGSIARTTRSWRLYRTKLRCQVRKFRDHTSDISDETMRNLDDRTVQI